MVTERIHPVCWICIPEHELQCDNYYKVKGIPGVIQFLGDSRNPSRLSYLEAEWIMLLTGENNQPIEPTVVRAMGDGNYETVKGVLEKFENRIIKYDKRSRKATFEITICNEKKEVQLSIRLEEDEELSLAGAGRDGAEGAAQEGFERSHLMAYG